MPDDSPRIADLLPAAPGRTPVDLPAAVLALLRAHERDVEATVEAATELLLALRPALPRAMAREMVDERIAALLMARRHPPAALLRALARPAFGSPEAEA
jgi:hypothetical protein